MQKIKIKSIYINSTDKEKKPLMDKNNNPYKRAVLTSENDSKASLMIYAEKESVYMPIIGFWKVGDTVEVNLTKNGEYFNFEPISEIESIKMRISRLEGALNLNTPQTTLKGQTEGNKEQSAQELVQDIAGVEPLPELGEPVKQTTDEILATIPF